MPAQHVEHLEEVLKHLKSQNCRFLQPSVTFLRYHIDAEGIHPLDDKLKGSNSQEHTGITLVPRTNQLLWEFIPNAATILMVCSIRTLNGDGQKSVNAVLTKLSRRWPHPRS